MSTMERLRTSSLFSVSTLLQLITAAGLAVDARIHLRLAPAYDGISGGTITQGGLFRVEAVLAIIAALAILVSRRAVVALFALAVSGGGLVPLLAYRYYDIGAIGPLPSMYEPSWYPDKTHTCIAQAIAAVAALILVVVAVLKARRSPAAAR
ncbi:MAG: integral rane protein [Marmoricola sp.]|nr:integral rane protein [Marmoricola sp.]